MPGVLLSVALLLLIWGVIESRLPIRIRRHVFGERGIRLLWISDFHCSRWNSLGRVRRTIQRIHRTSPDVVLLGGDYVDRGLSYVEPCIQLLSSLQPAAAILGNHEVQTKRGKNPRESIVRALEASGIPVLYNSSRLVTCKGRTLQLVGSADCRRDIAYIGHIRRKEEADLVLFLTHNPDALPVAAGGLDFDLALCGHTHGGQISLFGKPLVTHSRYKKLGRGICRYRNKPVVVTNGVGTTILPLRFFSFPSVELIDL